MEMFWKKLHVKLWLLVRFVPVSSSKLVLYCLSRQELWLSGLGPNQRLAAISGAGSGLVPEVPARVLEQPLATRAPTWRAGPGRDSGVVSTGSSVGSGVAFTVHWLLPGLPLLPGPEIETQQPLLLGFFPVSKLKGPYGIKARVRSGHPVWKMPLCDVQCRFRLRVAPRLFLEKKMHKCAFLRCPCASQGALWGASFFL